MEDRNRKRFGRGPMGVAHHLRSRNAAFNSMRTAFTQRRASTATSFAFLAQTVIYTPTVCSPESVLTYVAGKSRTAPVERGRNGRPP